MSKKGKTPKHDIPDLSRTARAIEEYDRADEKFRAEVGELSIGEADRRMDDVSKLGEAVGIAFGLDTANRNDPETCRACIRPGPKVPHPGFQLTFVRKCVKQWEEFKSWISRSSPKR